MRSLPRAVLRLAAFLVLAGLLVGIPVVVGATVGVPLPSMEQWRTVWTTGRVESDFVVRLGAAVFALLWAWFAVTALTELWRVLPRRHELTDKDLGAAGGPSGWVRGLVRVVAVSSVSASAALGALSVTAHQTSVGAAPRPASTGQVVGSTPSLTSHVVVEGDCYWRIADEHLQSALQREPTGAEVAGLTDVLVATNGTRLGHRDRTLLVPGEVVMLPTDAAPAGVPLPPPASPPPAPPPPAAVTPVVPTEVPTPGPPPVADSLPTATQSAPVVARAAEPDGSFSYTAGLSAAVLMSAGALGAVEMRRRRQLRAGVVGARPLVPSLEQVRTEVLLRSLSSSERIARLDVALRNVGRELAAQRASVTAVVLGDAGDVRLFLRGAAVPVDGPWQVDLHSGSWLLPASVPLDVLVPAARECAHPCPALAHLGTVDEGGELFVDLEAIGVLAVQSPSATAIIRAMAASLSISPFLDAGRVVSVGLGDAILDAARGDRADTLVAAVGEAQLAIGAIGTIARDTTTFSLRVDGAGGEAWEPAVVFASGVSAEESDAVGLSTLGGGRGLGVVVDAAVEGAARLMFDGLGHVLEPLALRVRPIGLEESDVAEVASLLRSADEPLAAGAPVVALVEPARPVVAFVEPEWALLVRVLGQLEVINHEGHAVQFDRSKSLELVAWLTQHRERPTRAAARTALWDVAVRDATFANVVSDARRAMARATAPPRDEEWIARTLTEDLPLHPAVLTDADLLAARAAAARGLSPIDAVEVLRPGLELVVGLPFAGTAFTWSDAEGHTSSLVLLATGAATELAHHYLALGDVEGVFWATGQGLRVLSGHEELIALRMRAHAQRGDLAGVRQEWESYERALAADSWAAAEPAQKLVELRRELLSPMSPTGTAGA